MRVLALACASAALGAASAAQAATGYGGWLGFGGGGLASTSAPPSGVALSADGGVRWKIKTVSSDPEFFAGAVASADGTMSYVVDNTGMVSALKIPSTNEFVAAFTGFPEPDVMWTYNGKSPVKGTPALSKDGTRLYVGFNSGWFVALDTKTGKVAWNANTGTPIESAPVISESAQSIVFGATSGMMWGFNTTTGESIWRCKGAGLPVNGAALSEDGKTAYMVSKDFYVYSMPVGGGDMCSFKLPKGGCTQATCGQPMGCDFSCAKWTLNLANRPIPYPPAYDAKNDTLYVTAAAEGPSTTGMGLYAIYPNKVHNDKPVYRMLASVPTTITSAPAYANGKAAFASDSKIYLVDTATAKIDWSIAYAGGKGINSSPVIDDKVVAFGGGDGRFYVVSVADGSILQKFTLEETKGIFTQAAIDSNGYYIVGTAGGTVWSIGGTTLGGSWTSPSLLAERVILGVVGFCLLACVCGCAIRSSRKRKRQEPALDVAGAPVTYQYKYQGLEGEGDKV